MLGGSPAPARITPRPGLPRHSTASQSCVVDAPSAYREHTRQIWCSDAQVAKVSLRTDTRNYIAQVYLSREAESAWRTSPEDVMAPFRHLIDRLSQSIRMNVAVTVRTAAGARLAICSRDLISRSATCVVR